MKKMKALKRKVAIWACLILGPMVFLVGFVSTFRDVAYMVQSDVVEGEITGSKEIRASRGPDQIQFTVDFTTPAGERAEGYLTAYDYQEDEILFQNPLKLLYMESDPENLRLDGFFPQGWIPIPLGAVMFLGAFWAYKKDKVEADKIDQGLDQNRPA